MKEEEAKTKWCPQAIAVPNATNYGSGNRFDVPAGFMECKCIASDCMMWVRTSGEWQIDGKQTPQSELDKYPTPESANAVWVNFGHCGLIK